MQQSLDWWSTLQYGEKCLLCTNYCKNRLVTGQTCYELSDEEIHDIYIQTH